MRRLLIVLILLVFPVPAMADNFSCSGPIAELGLASGGNVTVDLGYGVWTICNLSGTSGSATKETCAGWYSSLITARAGTKTITLYFTPSDNSGITTCSGLGTWSVRAPYFLEWG